MGIEASLTLQMDYYNSQLALWEPLIESVEVVKNNKSEYVPWELKLEVRYSVCLNLICHLELCQHDQYIIII